MSNYFVKVEGLLYDALIDLDETGTGGTYRNEVYEQHETYKAALNDATGVDFRQGKHRMVLDQLVDIGLVVKRVTGARGNVAFYSIAEGMTKDDFFQRKGKARFEWKNTRTAEKAIANSPDLVERLDGMTCEDAYTWLSDAITAKLGSQEKVSRTWQAYKAKRTPLGGSPHEKYDYLDTLPDDSARRKAIVRLFSVTGEASVDKHMNEYRDWKSGK